MATTAHMHRHDVSLAGLLPTAVTMPRRLLGDVSAELWLCDLSALLDQQMARKDRVEHVECVGLVGACSCDARTA